jgi:hypothetical protein
MQGLPQPSAFASKSPTTRAPESETPGNIQRFLSLLQTHRPSPRYFTALSLYHKKMPTQRVAKFHGGEEIPAFTVELPALPIFFPFSFFIFRQRTFLRVYSP